MHICCLTGNRIVVVITNLGLVAILKIDFKFKFKFYLSHARL